MVNINNMESSIFAKIKDLLAKDGSIGIAVGKNPSLDEMAGALSLYLTLSQLNKAVSIACPTNPIVEISSLVGINKVKTNFEGEGGDLVVSFPYKEGEIEKVSYTLEDGFLNIIVKAGELGLSFNERDIQYRRSGGFPNLIFVIGTPRLSDLGNLFNAEAMKDTTVINIDNKTDNQGFGDVVFVSPRFSSVSEQVAELISDLTPRIDVDIAQNLLSGISFATDNFQSSKASPLAFEMAGILMKSGAIRESRKQAPRYQEEDPFLGLQNQPRRNFPQQEENDQFLNQNQRRDQENQEGTREPRFNNQQRGSQQSSRSQVQGQSQNQRQPQQGENKKNPPSDWLTPKIYKGSTNI